jgi:glycosyltransferase involved in cell wall biosynthesis
VLATNKPQVSIITPAYNASPYILGTYESIRAQDMEDWEWLVVVDGGSTDETLSIVERLAQTDPRVRILNSPEIRGTANNRNHAYKNARGKYIAFLDSDDQWLPYKLSRQIEFMQTQQSPFSFTAYEWMDEQGLSLGKMISAPQKITYLDLLSHRHTIGCLTVMIEREPFKDLSYEDIGAEDFTFWLKLLRQIPYASGMSENLGRYRIVPGSRSRNKIRWALHRWESLRESEKIPLLPALYYFSLYAGRALFARI